MGASINIYWTDGVARTAVEEVVKFFEGAGFDGSIDLKYYKTHYMTKDGKIILGKSQGTQGSMGYYPAYKNPLPEGATEVSLGADFIFANRELSEELVDRIAREMATFDNVEYKGLDTPYHKDEIDTWRHIVWKFVQDKDLTNYNGISRTECSCGSYPQDWFKMNNGGD